MKKKIPTKRKSKTSVRSASMWETCEEETAAHKAIAKTIESSRTLVNYSKLSPPNQRAAIAMAMLVCELAGDFK